MSALNVYVKPMFDMVAMIATWVMAFVCLFLCSFVCLEVLLKTEIFRECLIAQVASVFLVVLQMLLIFLLG